MSYQVLALKYRPRTFEEVIGQEHVTTTLANAITADRVAHAILFTGPRGTGKTTIARILAKAMTCATGPTPAPCNTCKICTDITNGHCSDVFEIDGASNNSVEQIRDLRENVAYMPASARFKIYIIDEVHMLSTAAFNALLKTLEEPPDHVLFIFATTEVHKIPATILSRCQRHDLARISLARISNHLARLSRQEGFTLDKESLDLVALEADGSIRDSLSLLDRIFSAGPDKHISRETVVDNLGTSDRRLMFELSSDVLGKDGAALIGIVQQVNDSGQDMKKFYADIIAQFRNLNIIKICGKDTPSLNLIDAERNRLAEMVSGVPQAYTGMLLQRLLDDEPLVRYASHPQTAIEMVLLKLIQISPGADLSVILSKLDGLARQIDAKPADTPPDASPHPAPEQPPAPVQPEPDPAPVPEPPPIPNAYPLEPQHAHHRTVPDNIDPRAGQAEPSPDRCKNDTPEIPGPVSWTRFLTILQTRQPSMFAVLSRGKAVTSNDGQVEVILSPNSDFEKKRIENKEKELQALSMQFMKKPLQITIKAGASEPKRPSQVKKAEDKARITATRHPMVQEARRIFNGEII